MVVTLNLIRQDESHKKIEEDQLSVIQKPQVNMKKFHLRKESDRHIWAALPIELVVKHLDRTKSHL